MCKNRIWICDNSIGENKCRHVSEELRDRYRRQEIFEMAIILRLDRIMADRMKKRTLSISRFFFCAPPRAEELCRYAACGEQEKPSLLDCTRAPKEQCQQSQRVPGTRKGKMSSLFDYNQYAVLMRLLLLNCLMESTGDNVRLLFRCQFDEVNSVTGYADGQLGIVLGMFLRIQEGVPVQYVNVKVMAAFCCISIQ